MTFTKQGEFSKDVLDLTDIPSQNMQPSVLKSYFQTPADELKTTVNKLVDDLNGSGWVDTPRLGSKAVTREKVAAGAIGVNEIDPAIMNQPTTAIGVQAKLDDHTTTLTTHTSQLAFIPNQTYITEKAKTTDVNNALALKADKSQVDNLIIASGTSNAETIQARGTFPILNDRLNSFSSQLNKSYEAVTVTWTDNGYYDSTGVSQYNTASKYASIPVTTGDLIKVTGTVNGAARYGVIIVDASNTVLASYLQGGGTLLSFNSYFIEVPSGARKALITTMNESVSTYKFEKLTNSINYEMLSKELKKSISSVYMELSGLVWQSGYYSSTGALTANAYSVSTAINVAYGDSFLITAQTSGSLKYVAMVTDINNNVLQTYLQGTNIETIYTNYQIDIPVNGVHLLITTDTSYQTNSKVKKLTPINFNEAVSNWAKYPLKNKKFIAYGDSTTEIGNWVSLVASELGITNYTNKGIGSTMLATVSVDSSLSTSTYPPGASDARIATIPNDTDIITIMFGHNDVGYGNAKLGNLGTIDSTDTGYYYGAYNYLIQQLYLKNPKIQIFIMTPPHSGWEDPALDPNWHTNIELCRKASREIAYKYSLPLVEMKENGINKLNRTTFHVDNSHPNALGGQRYAQCILSKLQAFYYMP